MSELLEYLRGLILFSILMLAMVIVSFMINIGVGIFILIFALLVGLMTAIWIYEDNDPPYNFFKITEYRYNKIIERKIAAIELRREMENIGNYNDQIKNE